MKKDIPNNIGPPKWADYILEHLCAPYLLEEIQGDLKEEFQHQLKMKGKRWARWDYIRNVIGFIRTFSMERKKYPHTYSSFIDLTMFKHYTTIAFRNISRNKVFSLINILGLTLGIVTCIVVFSIVRYEYSFDAFHPDKDRIYRIIGEIKSSDGKQVTATFPPPFTEAAREELPGIENIAGYYFFNAQVKNNINNAQDLITESHIKYNKIIITSPEYFNIFRYKWLAGNPQSLNEPFRVVLTENIAETYFGSIPLDKMIGKELIYNDSLTVYVSGIIREWTEPTDFPYTDFISLPTVTSSFLKEKIKLNDWLKNNQEEARILVKIAKNIKKENFIAHLNNFLNNHLMVKPPVTIQAYLQSLSDVHFTDDYARGSGILHEDQDHFRKAYKPTLYILSGSALFILLIAIINFNNLSTAQSIRRKNEIGIRKVLGGSIRSLKIQFLTETFVITVISFLISLLLMSPILQAFKLYIPNGVRFNPLDTITIEFILGLCVIIVFLAGLYPAFMLSGLIPAKILKGNGDNKKRTIWNFKKGLIILQFSISMIFIVGSIVMQRQLAFMINNTGLPVKGVLYIFCGKGEKNNVLVNKIKQLSNVENVALQSVAPIASFAHMIDMIRCNGQENPVSIKGGDPDIISVYRIKLIAGRNIQPADTLREFIVNETFIRQFGFEKPADALGRNLYYHGKEYQIAGVIKDFHEGSMHDVIMPLAIGNLPFKLSIAVRLKDINKGKNEIQSTLSLIEKQWKQIYPDNPFNYSFISDKIEEFYKKDEQAANIINIVMLITIFIACMGIFGLVMFASIQRMKEIGIRKVFGATTSTITIMLTREIVVLCLISLIIASPVAWYAVGKWLQDFPYRINLSWWIYLLAGLIMIFIALMTTGYQALKAAMSKPVKSLRYE